MKKIIKNIRFYLKKEFGILTKEECESIGLTFCHNIFGDEINHLNCRSIWRDERGKSYRCKDLFLSDRDKKDIEVLKKFCIENKIPESILNSIN